MIRAGRIVAGGLRRLGADKPSAGNQTLARERLTVEDKVLRSEAVRQGDGVLGGTGDDDRAM